MLLHRKARRGSSYLEIQVAMVLLSIGTAGLYSMSVVHTKQTHRLTDVLPAEEIPAMNRSADAWARKLGVYASLDDAVAPFGDLTPYSYQEHLVDNQDGGATHHKHPSDTYDWVSWGYAAAHLGNIHYHRSLGDPRSYFEFQVTGLPIGEYEVLTSYPVFAVVGTAVPHLIYDGAVLRATVNVDQTSAPLGVTANGRQWRRLALIDVQSGTVRVRLNDGPGCEDYLIADAVLVRSARSMSLLSLGRTGSGGAVAVLEGP